jgi:hypothetical protein
MKRRGSFVVCVAIAWSFVLAAVDLSPAEAQRSPEDVFAGQILTSSKRFPMSARSQASYVKQLRAQSAKRFQEDKKHQRWRIHYAAFFRRPLNDLEVTIKLYDVSGRERHQLAAFEQFLDRRGQRSIISSLTLDRERFGVNKEILMTVENRGRVLASGKFRILGEAERYSGKVEFTEEEAAAGVED